jgi:nucleoside-diphosphate-sugar epimerase
MRIFLTGATGYVGSAVLDSLLRARHQVTGLVRNGEKAAMLSARGAVPIVGNLSSPSSFRQAVGYDVYIHAANDRSNPQEIDWLAVESLLALARQAPNTTLVYTSDVRVLGTTGSPADETAPLAPAALVAWRPAHEQLVLQAAGQGLRTIVVRPGIVYGGSDGIIGDMFRDAKNGLMRVIGDGKNHWPCVYDRDLGDLYARLIARPDASGVFHATDEGDERVNDIVDAISSHLPMQPDVRHVPLAEARLKLGPLADALALDQIVRSPRARAIGWAPSQHSVARNVPRLLEEWRAARELAAQRL